MKSVGAHTEPETAEVKRTEEAIKMCDHGGSPERKVLCIQQVSAIPPLWIGIDLHHRQLDVNLCHRPDVQDQN